MICDHDKHALVERAAAGVEPNPELHAHLQACSSCRNAFENERSLLASIDSCLRSSANADIPSSFVPTVRARLWREPPPVRRSGIDRLLWVPALAAAAIILFIFTHVDRRVKPQQFVTQRPESPVAPPTTAGKLLQRTIPQIAPAIGKSFSSKAVTRDKQSVQAKSREPEIIVPPDQEILLARYADHFRRHHQASSILLTDIEPTQTYPSQVPLIQIAELDVKPLAPQRQDDQQSDQEYDLRKE